MFVVVSWELPVPAQETESWLVARPLADPLKITPDHNAGDIVNELSSSIIGLSLVWLTIGNERAQRPTAEYLGPMLTRAPCYR